MEENRPPSGREPLQKPKARHEHTGINVSALAKFGAGLVLMVVATVFLMWFVFDAFTGREAAEGPPPSQEVDVDSRKLPPEPRLQPAPVQDLERMRAAEDELMNGYAWLDAARKTARIPVNRAMDLIAREGLPARAAAAPPPDDVTLPAESGLGPIMTQVGGPLSPNRNFPPDQALQLHGGGSPFDGRQAGGPPTPPDRSLGAFVREAAPAARQETEKK